MNKHGSQFDLRSNGLDTLCDDCKFIECKKIKQENAELRAELEKYKEALRLSCLDLWDERGGTEDCKVESNYFLEGKK